MLSYSISANQPMHSVPSLDDLIVHDVSIGNYNKLNFVHYLSQTHSLENMEFIVELNKYLASEVESERRSRWKIICKTFLLSDSPKEINLPHSITKNFVPQMLPNGKILNNAWSMIYDLLLDSYHEFVKHVKTTTKDRARRQSDTVSPSDASRHLSTRQIPRSVSVSENVRPYIPSSVDVVRHTEMQRRKSASPKTGSSSTSSSRGSSVGSMPDSLRENDPAGWKKAVRKFSFRRNSNE